MSITVKQIILHQIIKAEPEGGNPPPLSSVLREQLLTITPEVEQMMLQLHQGYQNKAKAYGVFQESSVFAQSLNRLLENELDFLPFSHEATHLLVTELSKYNFADSGTLVLCQYNFLATDYLFIALLDSRVSMLVNEQLEIQRTEYLDITQFDVAARINLTDLQLNANSNRYLTFIKGRVGRKIADLSDYCVQGELNPEQTQAVKKQVFEYCKGQMNSGEEIELTELSEELPTLNQQPFVTFTQEQDYGLEDRIPPVRTALKSLTKFSGSGKGVTISFDAELINQRIIWDEADDTLTIKGLPPNLRDQLQRRLKEQN